LQLVWILLVKVEDLWEGELIIAGSSGTFTDYVFSRTVSGEHKRNATAPQPYLKICGLTQDLYPEGDVSMLLPLVKRDRVGTPG
jgi:hypothetical protein